MISLLETCKQKRRKLLIRSQRDERLKDTEKSICYEIKEQFELEKCRRSAKKMIKRALKSIHQLMKKSEKTRTNLEMCCNIKEHFHETDTEHIVIGDICMCAVIEK